MPKGTVRVVLDIRFEGDYLNENERMSCSEDWIGSGLEDRDDLVGWSVVEMNHVASNGITEETA